jgi:TRAP-type C4-dicarboxylate transport system substrate-binding protein
VYTRRQFGTRSAALAAAFASRPIAAHAAPAMVRFASISTVNSDSFRLDLEPFAHAIEAEAAGRLNISLKPDGGYGKAAELFGMVERGDVEMTASVQGYYPGRFPRSSVIELPMLFTDALTGTKALTALEHEGLLDGDYTSVKVLALYVTSPYSIFTTGKKINSVRDLRGLRIRTPSPTVGLPLARLGAIPLGTPASIVGDAISSGMIDAMAYGMNTALSTRTADGRPLSEKMSVVLELPFASPGLMMVMNRAAWDALPADLQAIFERHAAAMLTEGARNRDRTEAIARQTLRADPRYTYIEPNTAFRAELERAMAPSFDDWKAGMGRVGIDGDRLLTRTRELIKQFAVAAQ